MDFSSLPNFQGRPSDKVGGDLHAIASTGIAQVDASIREQDEISRSWKYGGFVLGFHILLIGCSLLGTRLPPSPPAKDWRHHVKPADYWSAETTFIFWDDHERTWDYTYAVRGDELILQVSNYEGFAPDKSSKRVRYRHTIVPSSIMRDLKEWTVRPGTSRPPSAPHSYHPYAVFSHTSNETEKRREAWFYYSDAHDWFELLRNEFVKDQDRVEDLPAWITEDKKVRPYFGIWE